LWLRYTAQLLCFPLKRMIEGVDVIHSVAPWELSHAANLVKGRIPHFVTGLLHPGQWADDANSIRHFQKCDHIIALSETERRAYLQWDIARDKVSVAGVPVREVEYQDAHPYRSTRIDPSKPLILFIGVKRAYKGIKLLLDATQHVWKVLPEAQFVFVGPRTNYSIATFASRASDARIIEIDAISEQDKWGLLEQCSLLCLPSETEIMPNVILEAWSKHKPVITSNIATLQEFIGDAGLCVPLNELAISEAIINLIQNPTVSKALGDLGWEKCVHEHNACRVRARLEEIYRALLE
jgi:glycosyltransferase involved in cell wall biosynthesis